MILVTLLISGSIGSAQEVFELDEYDNWSLVEKAPIGSPEEQLFRAEKFLTDGKIEECLDLTSRWIERFGDHPLLPNAYLLRGDAKDANGNEYEALYDYEFLIRSFPNHETFITANERELNIGMRYASGLKKRAFGIRFVSAVDEAVELMIRVQERLPRSQLAEKACMALGDYYFSTQQVRLASKTYEIFLQNFPKSTNQTKALRRLIFSQLAGYRGPNYNDTPLKEAIARLKKLQTNAPGEARALGAEALKIRLEESQARKLLEQAKWYLKTNDLVSCEYMLRRLLDLYPLTASATESITVIQQIYNSLPNIIKLDMNDHYQSDLLYRITANADNRGKND